MKRVELLLLLSFLLFVQGYLLENVLPAVMGFGILTYLTVLRTDFRPEVRAERKLGKTMQEGKREPVVLRIRNLSNHKLLVRIREVLPPGFSAESPEFTLDRLEEKTVQYAVIPVKGSYVIQGPLLEVADERMLFCTHYRVNAEDRVDVYPSLERIKEDMRSEENIRLAEVYREFLLGLQVPEIQSLRRFQEGDELRHIDWKATARLGELIVREFLREDEGDVYIILDAGREMRKGVKESKIDYAVTLALALMYVLKRYRVGLIVYDDYGVLSRIEASESRSRIEKALRALAITPKRTRLIGVQAPDFSSLGISSSGKKFLEKLVPIIKKRKSLSSGLLEAISSLPSKAFLVFVVDITAHTGELVRVLMNLKDRYRILLITPNPVLFYDESRLSKERLIWLYRRYVERERLIRRMNRIVPTIDVGPSDLAEVIRGALR